MVNAVVWFRRDFRFQDHLALSEALAYCKKNDGKLLFVFHLNRDFFGSETDMRLEYFMATVKDFAERCEELGTHLIVIQGTPEEAFENLLKDHSAVQAVFFNKDEAGYGKERDDQVIRLLEKKNVEVYPFQDAYVHGPNEIFKKDGSVYKVFSPYYRAWKQLDKPPARRLTVKDLQDYVQTVKASSDLKDVNKLAGTNDEWEIGEKAARKQLRSFVNDKLDAYPKSRDLPAEKGTSLMSRYLKTGTISPRTVFGAVAQAEGSEDSKEAYIRELAFRDFYQMIFAHFPETSDQEFLEQYRSLEWNSSKEDFKAWKDGATGYPIVDAGMRQLNAEGWMHNRLRMITASFLSKDLLIDWRMGERFFASKLVDYDPGSNIGGWQWAASVGTDAVPYFRVFNPVTQSKRFDKKGDYIRKYVPELKDVPDQYIHEPWKMNEDEQKEASCIVGNDYPLPMIDHQEQRKKAISLFKE
ncbi:deoxyribodipyrimidine photo-lyase [Bacillus mangrovi]|uniref:Deoxyribodipyrimidine photo-lyase n=1 Tax=Metabacillus mangrovi TaxID=1491830 RepID=A0A7X2V403_9BACI|nr:deoxyribodipyrimidine photo-lyase [Metabacillus mangrovi]MTH52591.1 deoxyribodipyrimidine photo-lyase [Metabacillus mangrovi]